MEVTLNGVPVVMRSVGQKMVALSFAKDELIARTQAAQEMLHAMRLLESVDSSVEKPTMFNVNNKGSIDITNDWTFNGRTKHVDTRCCFLRELNEQGAIE